MEAVAVIIPNPLEAQLPVLSAELCQRRDDLVASAQAITVIGSHEDLLEAEKTFRAIDAYRKQVKEDRLALTRRIDALKAEIMKVEADAVQPLESVRDTLAKAIGDYREAAERARREAERRQREEAERLAAEAEAKRRAEAEAKAKQAAEEAALFGSATDEPEPEPVIIAAIPAEVPSSVVMPAPLPRSAVRKTTRTVLRIFDEAALLAEACKQGGNLYGRRVLLIDEKAVEKLLGAGVAVPGATLDKVEKIGASGR